MRVVTLNPERFHEECGRLGRMALQGGPYRLLIGIRNGGAYVADAMQKEQPQLDATARYDVSLQRASTPGRSRKMKAWLRRLPRPILNLMRMAESIYDSMTESRERNKALSEARITIPTDISNFSIGSGRVLIVDDAVDSGVTLSVVKERIAGIYPEADIKTAALTVTRDNPEIIPDFSLYTDHTLLRFPWSNDY